jgi:hypothetical protein
MVRSAAGARNFRGEIPDAADTEVEIRRGDQQLPILRRGLAEPLGHLRVECAGDRGAESCRVDDAARAPQPEEIVRRGCRLVGRVAIEFARDVECVRRPDRRERRL